MNRDACLRKCARKPVEFPLRSEWSFGRSTALLEAIRCCGFRIGAEACRPNHQHGIGALPVGIRRGFHRSSLASRVNADLCRQKKGARPQPRPCRGVAGQNSKRTPSWMRHTEFNAVSDFDGADGPVLPGARTVDVAGRRAARATGGHDAIRVEHRRDVDEARPGVTWPQSLSIRLARFSTSSVTTPRALRQIGISCARRRSSDVTQGLRCELRGTIRPR